MPKSNSRSRNNNLSGRNQYSSDFGVTELVRERPIAAAAAAAGAAAAGLFLWSRRQQISNQLSNLSDQIGEWRESFSSGEGQFETGDDTAGLTTSTASSNRRGTSETGGGNASLGRRSGGGGIRSTASGRGRARAVRTSETS
jgi:hypothetical protein